MRKNRLMIWHDLCWYLLIIAPARRDPAPCRISPFLNRNYNFCVYLSCIYRSEFIRQFQLKFYYCVIRIFEQIVNGIELTVHFFYILYTLVTAPQTSKQELKHGKRALHEVKLTLTSFSFGLGQYCEDKNTLEKLCSEIPGDASLYSLFRMDAQPIECPFKWVTGNYLLAAPNLLISHVWSFSHDCRGAPFTFTYNRGHGECREPVSHVDTCTDNSRLLLRFQACPNVQKTESTSKFTG